MNNTMRGLPLTLADGKDYYFSAMPLGPKGDAFRKNLSDFFNVLTKISLVQQDKSTEGDTVEKLAAILKENSDIDALEAERLKAFTELASLSLAVNYPDSAKHIAEELITPDLIYVVIRVIKGGQYPEGFTPPLSKQTGAAVS